MFQSNLADLKKVSLYLILTLCASCTCEQQVLKVGDDLTVVVLPRNTVEYGKPIPIQNPINKKSHYNYPEQISLTLGGNDGQHDGSIYVGWITPQTAQSTLRWFSCTMHDVLLDTPYNCSLLATFDGQSHSYELNQYKSGRIHNVVIPQEYMEPGKQYYYSVGGDDEEYRSKLIGFQALPRVCKDCSVKFGLVGDLGQTYHSLETISHLQNLNADMILHVGDLSYADGIQARWDNYGRILQPVSSTHVISYTPGNHELERHMVRRLVDRPEVGLFYAFMQRFPSPAPIFNHGYEWYNQVFNFNIRQGNELNVENNSNKQQQKRKVNWRDKNFGLFYSFNTGSAHVIVLNSYERCDNLSQQYMWLEKDFKSIDRDVTPWVLVVMHAPWYNTNYAHNQEFKHMRKAMEPLFNQYRVDIVFAGHVHAYERTKPVRDYDISRNGTVYINIGDGGNKEGLAQEYIHPQPEWSDFRDASYGHGILHIKNSTHARWAWKRNTQLVKAYKQHDKVELGCTKRDKSHCVGSNECEWDDLNDICMYDKRESVKLDDASFINFANENQKGYSTANSFIPNPDHISPQQRHVMEFFNGLICVVTVFLICAAVWTMYELKYIFSKTASAKNSKYRRSDYEPLH